jgi:hypothetical protein
MSITQDMTQPASRPPVGAIPQARPDSFVAKIDPSEPLRLLSREGDTDVVFRLGRGLSFLQKLREQARAWLDRLEDYRTLLIAGAVGLVALAGLSAVIGGAYHKQPTPEAPAKAAAPAIVTLPAAPLTAPVAAPAPPVAPAHASAPVRPRVIHAKRTAKPTPPRHLAR